MHTEMGACVGYFARIDRAPNIHRDAGHCKGQFYRLYELQVLKNG